MNSIQALGSLPTFDRARAGASTRRMFHVNRDCVSTGGTAPHQASCASWVPLIQMAATQDHESTLEHSAACS